MLMRTLIKLLISQKQYASKGNNLTLNLEPGGELGLYFFSEFIILFLFPFLEHFLLVFQILYSMRRMLKLLSIKSLFWIYVHMNRSGKLVSHDFYFDIFMRNNYTAISNCTHLLFSSFRCKKLLHEQQD